MKYNNNISYAGLKQSDRVKILGQESSLGWRGLNGSPCDGKSLHCSSEDIRRVRLGVPGITANQLRRKMEHWALEGTSTKRSEK